MRTTLAAVLGLSLFVEPSRACRFSLDLIQDMEKADSVFVGRIVDFTPVPDTRPVGNQAVAVTLDVQRVIRGREVSGRLIVYGYNSIDTRFPRSVEEFKNGPAPLVEVAIVFPDTIEKNTICRYQDQTPYGGSTITVFSCKIDLPVRIPLSNNGAVLLDHPTIMSWPCGPSHIKPVLE